MTIAEYEAHFYVSSRYFSAIIFTKFEKVKKFVNGLVGSY